jgi:hypothetical protein
MRNLMCTFSTEEMTYVYNDGKTPDQPGKPDRIESTESLQYCEKARRECIPMFCPK